MGIFGFFRNKRRSGLMPESSVLVGFDTERIWARWPDKPEQSLLWSELIGVAIETNDKGPFEPDVFFILGAKDRILAYPQGATGDAEVLRQLQKLPGFDNEAVIKAMGSTENNVFVCWEKPSKSTVAGDAQKDGRN